MDGDGLAGAHGKQRVFGMASLSWPWEPLEPSEAEVDAEEADNPTQRMYDEMNRSIEPQMEEWRPNR